MCEREPKSWRYMEESKEHMGLCRYSGHAGAADFIKNLSGVIEVPKTDEMNVNIAGRKV